MTPEPIKPKPTWIVMPVMANRDLTIAALADCLAQSVPVRILIILQDVPQAFRQEIEHLAEQDPRVLCWFHSPPMISLSATWNRALRFVWATGGTEALVVNNDVRLRYDTVSMLSTVMDQLNALFVTAVGVTGEQYAASIGRPAIDCVGDLSQLGGPDFSCFLITKAGHESYPFDESFIPAYGEDCDLHRRFMLNGDGDKIFSINLPYHHVDHGSGTLKGLPPEQRQALERRLGRSREYYAQKWGGPINAERWTIPFDPTTDQDGVTNPALQRACLRPEETADV